MRGHIVFMVFVAAFIGYLLGSRSYGTTEGFEGDAKCGGCGGGFPCKRCPEPRAMCPACREPDLSRYVLRATVPPCQALPDMSQYMLKTECPPTPDLSKYVLKSSIPKQQPIIIDNSACRKESGECPPCPRPRCPQVHCAPPTKCPPPAPCPRPVCPPQVVKCRAETQLNDTVRPFLAPLSMSGFGEGFRSRR